MILEMGRILGDRYEIVEEIGAGGMSRVYRAVDKKLHRNVTCKVLREEFISDENFVNRFDIEARAIASLNHANIVNVYDVGKEGDVNYIVMEYIHGKTLKDLILERAPFSNEAMLGVASQIAAALIHAHESGIIHRDIKPQNILCMPNGVVKVADFGIARSHNARRENDEFSTMGSVHYISPEVACNDPIDPRSDLYSLGIVMYEMMTGELPFDSDNADEVATAHVEAPFPNARKKNPAILPIVREIFVRLTNKQPFRRYQSANSLYHDIQRAIMECTSAEPRAAMPRHEDGLDVSPSTHAPRTRPVQRTTSKSPQDKRKERFILLGGVATAVLVIAVVIWLISPFGNGGNGYNGLQLVSVPVLISVGLDDAQEQIEALGLELSVAGNEYHDEIPAGYITWANFDPDAQVEPGTVVEVLLSLGAADAAGIADVEVPDITGLHLNEAVLELIGLPIYFHQDYTLYAFDDVIPNQHIISQNPAPGAMVTRGSIITITLSRGPLPVMITVPNIIGLDESQARSALIGTGFLIGAVTSQEHLVYGAGTVIHQSISEGSERPPGTAVDFIVSLGVITPPESDDDEEDDTNGDDYTDTDIDDDNGNGDVDDDNGEDDDTPPNDTPTLTTRILQLNPQGVPADRHVTLILQRRTPDGFLVTEHLQDVTAADFPLEISVQGTGLVEFVLHIDGQEIGSDMVNFDE